MDRLDQLRADFNQKHGRIHKLSQDSMGRSWRDFSRHFTWIFYKLGISANAVTLSHFVFDSAAVVMIALQEPLLAVLCWAIGHLLDSSDGDLARVTRGPNMLAGQADTLFHLSATVAFFIVAGWLYQNHLIFLLAGYLIMIWHRSKVQTKDRWGERSKLWFWIVRPTEVTTVYLAYVFAFYLNVVEYYILFYSIYFVLAATGQSLLFMKKALFPKSVVQESILQAQPGSI